MVDRKWISRQLDEIKKELDNRPDWLRASAKVEGEDRCGNTGSPPPEPEMKVKE